MSLVSGNLFIDILSTPSSFRIYDYLRSEANTAFQTESDWGNPAALKSMTVTDSVIRESIRFSSIQTRGILRAVTAKDGVTLPDGTHVPQGTWIGVPVEAVHFDDRFYERPFEYNPFRFVKTGPGVSEGGQRLEATDISDKFLGWSYGRYPWYTALRPPFHIPMLTPYLAQSGSMVCRAKFEADYCLYHPQLRY